MPEGRLERTRALYTAMAELYVNMAGPNAPSPRQTGIVTNIDTVGCEHSRLIVGEDDGPKCAHCGKRVAEYDRKETMK